MAICFTLPAPDSDWSPFVLPRWPESEIIIHLFYLGGPSQKPLLFHRRLGVKL
ncbi:hypothetical protein DsansV1_C04g0038621 [Dioscorea sansibarensis]